MGQLIVKYIDINFLIREVCCVLCYCYLYCLVFYRLYNILKYVEKHFKVSEIQRL